MPDPLDTAPSIIQVALAGRCPKCGAQTLFSGWIKFADTCSACGLNFAQFNVGDGAAAFLIFIVGALVFAGIIIMELSYSPPWWVHLLIWVPVTLGLTVGLLRVSKAALLAAEHRNAAREGKIIS